MVDRVIAECRSYSAQANTHSHAYAQLILPLQGCLQVATLHQQVQVDSSNLFFVPPGCEHTFQAADRNEFLVLDIPPLMLDQPTAARQAPTSPPEGIAHPLDEQWQALRYLLLTEARQSNPMLGDLVRYACQRLSTLPQPRSLAYLHAHYHESISVEQLAAMEGYTPAYYSEWFKAKTNLTPKQYLHRLRLQRAKALLQETDLPLGEIALQVGYEHHASLTRLFKQHEGLSPHAYRQQIRGSNNDPKFG